MIYEKFKLKTSPCWIILEPINTAIIADNILVIDRRTGSFELRVRENIEPLYLPDRDKIVYGIAGIFNSFFDRYLVVVTKRTSLGRNFMGEEVFRIDKFELISMVGAFDPTVSRTDYRHFENPPVIHYEKDGSPKRSPYSSMRKLRPSTYEANAELLYKTMLKNALSVKSFYMSYSLDLTNRLQAQAQKINFGLANPELANEKFFWNRYLAESFREAGILQWVVPIVLGYINCQKAIVSNKTVHILLISRVGCDRPGFRYTRRGLDQFGEAANFIETEQIISRGDSHSAFVQIRGSPPVVWNQKMSMNFHPSIKVKTSGNAVRRHVEKLQKDYGDLIILSLLKSIKWETPLNETLHREVIQINKQKNENSRECIYLHWDFTKEVDKQNFSRAHLFYDASLRAFIRAMGTFVWNSSVIEKVQGGVVRTHDLDSVDKTNVMQYLIASRVLIDQLADVGALTIPIGDQGREFVLKTFSQESDVCKTINKLWCENSHRLSYIYTGGRAMKTHYITRGSRNFFDIFENFGSVRRFLTNNFLDGYKQDCVSLLMGEVPVDQGVDLDKIQAKNTKIRLGQSLMFLFILSLFSMFITLIITDKPWLKALGFVIFSSISSGLFWYILNEGSKFVYHPSMRKDLARSRK